MQVPLRYNVDVSGVAQQRLKVDMSIDLPGNEPLDVALPFSSPGSPANSRNHTSKLSRLEVKDAAGQPLAFQKLAEGGWRVQRSGAGAVTVSYNLAADEFACSKNHLTPEHAYLNGAAAFMYVKGHDRDLPSVVTVNNVPDPSWSAISTLPSVKGSANQFYAISGQELFDSNIEISSFDKAEATVGDIHITIARHGKSPWTRLADNEHTAQENLSDFLRIYRTFEGDFGKFPLQRYNDSPALPPEVDDRDRYTIIKHYVNSDALLSSGFEHYHGHELAFTHANEEGIHRVYEDSARIQENKVMAHELGHRLLAKYVQHDGIDSSDLSHEHASDGLWLTEGVTEWLGTKGELRSGLITDQQYLKRLESQINRYQQDYATDTANARDDSMDAQNGRSEYYTKGAVMGAMLDLEILRLTDGRKSFKDVLVGLKSEFGGTGNFHKVDDIERVAASVTDDAAGMKSFFDDNLRGHGTLDFNRYLEPAGLRLVDHTDRWPQGALHVGNAVLLSDANGRPSLAAAVPEGVSDKFRVNVAGVGVTLGCTDDGKLKIFGVSETGPAFAAGLKPFEGAVVGGLKVRIAGQDVDVASASPGPIEAMTFQIKSKNAFSGTEELVEIPVAVTDAKRSVVEETAAVTEAQKALRSQWLSVSQYA